MNEFIHKLTRSGYQFLFELVMKIRELVEGGMAFPDVNKDYLPLLAKHYEADYGHPSTARGHKENGIF